MGDFDVNSQVNGCGIHIHNGTSCDSAAAVGGHFFQAPVTKVRDAAAADFAIASSTLHCSRIHGRLPMAHTTHPAISPALSVRLDTRWKPTGVRLLYFSRLRLLPSAVQSACPQTFCLRSGFRCPQPPRSPNRLRRASLKTYASVLSGPSESALAGVILP